MNEKFYTELSDLALREEPISLDSCRKILSFPQAELLSLLQGTFKVRKHFVGLGVKIHIINNAQNGYCPEDCHYCAQAKTSDADIEEYPLKPDHEILAEAKNAYERGAYRYCMVFAGRGPTKGRVEHLAQLIHTIKSRYPIQICVSCGLLNEEKAKILKEAGLDRLNHNLNTSRAHYPEICTTHTFEDRLNTLKAARGAGIQLCSGMIVGMGETIDDIIEVAFSLREIKAESVPVNFLIPIEGNKVKKISNLSPEYCLRILCLFRLLNPKAEIRIAAGREVHLRSLEVMGLYAANSLFLDGYLNTKGESRIRTLQMIKDAGFTIESDHSLDSLIEEESKALTDIPISPSEAVVMKNLQDLRPEMIS